MDSYAELSDQLVARGLPRDAVRFVHEAKTDWDKAQLFAACRSGGVAVLIGSTEKMGAGTFTDPSYSDLPSDLRRYVAYMFLMVIVWFVRNC